MICAFFLVCIADRAVRRSKEEDSRERRPGPINPDSRLPRDPTSHWPDSAHCAGIRTVFHVAPANVLPDLIYVTVALHQKMRVMSRRDIHTSRYDIAQAALRWAGLPCRPRTLSLLAIAVMGPLLKNSGAVRAQWTV